MATAEHLQALRNELAQARARQTSAQINYGIYSETYLEASDDVRRLLTALGQNGTTTSEKPVVRQTKPRIKQTQNHDDDWPEDCVVTLRTPAPTSQKRTEDLRPSDFGKPNEGYRLLCVDGKMGQIAGPDGKTDWYELKKS